MLTPRSALLHLDGSARTVERIRSACQLADTFEADVAGLPSTLSALMRYPFAVEAATEAVAIMQRPDKEVAMARAGRTSVCDGASGDAGTCAAEALGALAD